MRKNDNYQCFLGTNFGNQYRQKIIAHTISLIILLVEENGGEMEKITLKGRVASGGGGGSYFVNLPWASTQFREKLCFLPYPGTLNVQLSPESAIGKLRKSKKGVKIKPPPNFCESRCFKALVMNKVWGAVLVPDVSNYPNDLLEILAPVNLRATLGLKDGMKVEVVVWL